MTVDGDFEGLLAYLKKNRGFDFTGYKRSTLERRVAKRMEAVGVAHFAEYVDRLEVEPDEFSELFNTILINVTSFFRDPEAWDYLRSNVVPELLGRKEPDTAIRVWSAGCASGEEPYSLAMVLADALGEEAFLQRVKIYATDIDNDALSDARRATFPLKAAEDCPPDLAARFLESTDHRLTFRRDLRRTIIFGRNDLIQDAPISHIDLLVCRNTLMYFNAEAQGRILARLHFALEDHGFVFLGKSEMLITHASLFTPLDVKRRMFTKVARPSNRDRFAFASSDDGAAPLDPAPLGPVREAALDAAREAQIAIDVDGRLSLANRAARELFHLVPADIGRPLRDLEVSYRPIELRGPIDAALREHQVQRRREIDWAPGPENRHRLDVEVKPLIVSKEAVGVLIAFLDVTDARALQEDLVRSRRELETAYEELQSTVEELETTNEELQSTNEELETTNEELQSTNEELETMNEELQSTNEELETINEELRLRSNELNRVNAFLETVLGATDLGVIVVGRDGRIQAWDSRSEDLWGLRADEAVNRDLSSLDIGLPVAELATTVLAPDGSDGGRHDVVLAAHNRRGAPIVCRVTATPVETDDPELRGGMILLVEEVEGPTARERSEVTA